MEKNTETMRNYVGPLVAQYTNYRNLVEASTKNVSVHKRAGQCYTGGNSLERTLRSWPEKISEPPTANQIV